MKCARNVFLFSRRGLCIRGERGCIEMAVVFTNRKKCEIGEINFIGREDIRDTCLDEKSCSSIAVV